MPQEVLSDEMHDLRLLHAAGDDGDGLAGARQDPVRYPARVVLLDLQGQPESVGEPSDRRASRRGERNAATAGRCVSRLVTGAAASVRIVVGALSRDTGGAGQGALWRHVAHGPPHVRCRRSRHPPGVHRGRRAIRHRGIAPPVPRRPAPKPARASGSSPDGLRRQSPQTGCFTCVRVSYRRDAAPAAPLKEGNLCVTFWGDRAALLPHGRRGKPLSRLD